MALNRFAVSIVARSAGQSSIARAAYNAREKLIDERTNEIKDYRHLGEPEWKGIFAPDQAPPWAMDRQALWNAVERREDLSTRPDQAQSARDFKIALPYELDREQRSQLTQEFACYMQKKGMIVDVVIHAPGMGDDPRNYHFHMLASMRAVGPDGFGNKVREWNRDTELLDWKEHWSELGARHLERAGYQREAERFRVGHLTLEKQREHAIKRGDFEWADDLDRTPTKHMGPQASAMERQGIETRKGDLNHEIEERNERRFQNRQLSRTEGESRLAYQLTERAQAFADALEDRGLILARVGEQDLEKLRAIEARRFREKETDHQRKLDYLDGRIAQEKEGGNRDKAAELRSSREELEDHYLGTLPWMMREGVTDLSADQRATAKRSYDRWNSKDRYSFEDYVTFVQKRWQERPSDRSRFNAMDLVVVDQRGDVYALTQRNTGDDPKVLRKYLREIETSTLFSVTGAWEVLKALNEHRREDALWPQRERVWPINPPEVKQDEGRWPGLAEFHSIERSWRSAEYRTVTDKRSLDAPVELNAERSRRFPEQPTAGIIWEAYNRNRHDVNAFADALDREGILLCAVTKTEADHSYHGAAFAREINHWSPSYRDGEIVAMGADARVHKLNERTTGAESDGLERYLRKMDRTQLPSIHEGTAIMHERAEAREAVAQLMGVLQPLQSRPPFERSLASELKSLTRVVQYVAAVGFERYERAGRTLGKVFEFGSNLFESLFSPVLTPEQKRLGEVADRERQLDALEAERLRSSYGRDR